MTKNMFNTIWSIAMYKGDSPFALKPMFPNKTPQLQAHNITDTQVQFVADPFMIKHKEEWFMFFEVLNNANGLGEIGFATSKNLKDWTYKNIILKEDIHFSYPFVFSHENRFFMIPETRQAQEIRLYTSHEIEGPWKQETVLIKGDYADPTVFYHNNRWWMFALEGKDNLHLFYSDNLFADWQKHPKTPIITNNKNNARPAGKIITYNGQLYRLAQDGIPLYGSKVRVFQITTLTTKTYKEQEIEESPILKGSRSGWNAIGMHHVDAHEQSDGSWIACVDGAKPDFKLQPESKVATTINS